jgi:hypothetical protein
VIIVDCTYHEKLDNLKVFQRFQGAHLELSRLKRQQFQTEVWDLGHTMLTDRVTTDSEKMQTVWEWPRKKHKHGSSPGVYSSYWRFTAGVVDVTKQLTQPRVDAQIFQWSPEADTIFWSLKELLCMSPISGYPQPDEEFSVDKNESTAGIHLLSEVQDNQKHVVACYGRTLSKAKKKYCMT